MCLRPRNSGTTKLIVSSSPTRFCRHEESTIVVANLFHESHKCHSHIQLCKRGEIKSGINIPCSSMMCKHFLHRDEIGASTPLTLPPWWITNALCVNSESWCVATCSFSRCAIKVETRSFDSVLSRLIEAQNVATTLEENHRNKMLRHHERCSLLHVERDDTPKSRQLL